MNTLCFNRKKKLDKNSISPKWNAIFTFFLVLFAICCLFPIILVYAISFTDETVLLRDGYKLIPAKFSLDGYKMFLIQGTQFLKSLRVSSVVTAIGTLTGLLVMSMFAYVISRKKFPLAKVFSYIAVFTLLFNGGLVPSYIINVTIFHLDDSLWVLFLPMCVNGYYILIMRTFFKTSLPDEIIESAKIDGASEYRIFFQIVTPVVKPVLATVGFFLVIEFWNDWFQGMLYINNPDLVSLQYMLVKIQNQLEFLKENININIGVADTIVENMPGESGRMALTALVMTPILLIFPFFQKYLLRGLTIGSIKG